jgi:regulator of sirC expression with transglutaminase-like and TPR domain
MLANLKGVYLRDSDFLRAARILERLCRLCPTDLLQRRDLGVALVQGGQPGRAIPHLTAYLDASPQAADTDTVHEFLGRARGEVARWN